MHDSKVMYEWAVTHSEQTNPEEKFILNPSSGDEFRVLERVWTSFAEASPGAVEDAPSKVCWFGLLLRAHGADLRNDSIAQSFSGFSLVAACAV